MSRVGLLAQLQGVHFHFCCVPPRWNSCLGQLGHVVVPSQLENHWMLDLNSRPAKETTWWWSSSLWRRYIKTVSAVSGLKTELLIWPCHCDSKDCLQGGTTIQKSLGAPLFGKSTVVVVEWRRLTSASLTGATTLTRKCLTGQFSFAGTCAPDFMPLRCLGLFSFALAKSLFSPETFLALQSFISGLWRISTQVRRWQRWQRCCNAQNEVWVSLIA